MPADLEGGSPSPNLVEVKGSEAQGRHREVGSEGSVEQSYEPTDRNWISRRQGWTSRREMTKSIFTKGRTRKPSGCVAKVRVGKRLTPGGLPCCLGNGTGGIERFHIARQESADGMVGQQGDWPKAGTSESGD
jgi:hypothetical protein